MAYVRKQWVDRSVQFPGRYAKSGESSTLVTLTESPGTVTQAGTPLNAANMNNIEDGIEERATWEAMYSAEREIAALKMASSLKDKVDGASDYFFDDNGLPLMPAGSAFEIDKTWNSLKTAVNAGVTVLPLLYNFSTRFTVGQEVTIQSAATETTRERRNVTAVDTVNNTITVSPGLTNGYSVGALVYRSWAERTVNSMKFKRSLKCLPIDTTQTNLTGTKITGSSAPSASGVNFISASNDAEYVTEWHTGTSELWWYKRYGDKHELLFKIPFSFILQGSINANQLFDAQISPDGQYVYIEHSSVSGNYSNYLTIIKRTSDNSYQFIQSVDVSSIGGINRGTMKFSPKGTYFSFATGNASTFLRVYKRSGDTLGNPCTVDTQFSVGPITQLTWSYDEQWVTAQTNSLSSNPSWIFVYRQVSDAFTRQATNTVLFNSSNNYLGQRYFSKDSQYFCIMAGQAGSALTIYVYKITGTTWTQTKSLWDVGTNIQQTFCLSPDSLYIYASSRFSTGSFGRFNLTDTSTAATTTNYNGGTQSTSAYFNFLTDPKGDFIWNTADGYFANMTPMDLLQVDVRYEAKNNQKPLTGMVAFAERLSSSAGTTVTAAAKATQTATDSFTAMDKVTETIDANSAMDTFTIETASAKFAALRLTVNRTGTGVDSTIIKLTGAIE